MGHGTHENSADDTFSCRGMSCANKYLRHLVYYEAPLDPTELVELLRDRFEVEGLVDCGAVNYQKDMAAKGISTALWAYTVTFGNPVGGAKFLAVAPDAVIDMPIRVGICGDRSRSTLVCHNMSSLFAAHNESLRPLRQNMDQSIGSVKRLAR